MKFEKLNDNKFDKFNDFKEEKIENVTGGEAVTAPWNDTNPTKKSAECVDTSTSYWSDSTREESDHYIETCPDVDSVPPNL